MPKFTIIVPIFNSETYLKACIDSILSQSFIDYELILIDDGSNDKSVPICREYAYKDKRIVFLQQKHWGVSRARNLGLSYASGEYVWFIDSDDYIAKDALKIIHNLINKNNLDLICFNFACDFDGDIKINDYCKNLEETMDTKRFLIHLFDMPRTITLAIGNKILRKDFIVNFFDEQETMGEDGLFLLQNCQKSGKVYFIKNGHPIYFWRQRSGSLTHNRSFLVTKTSSLNKMLKYAHFRKLKMLVQRDYLDSLYGFIQEDKVLFEQYKRYVGKHFLSIIMNKNISLKLKGKYFFALFLK